MTERFRRRGVAKALLDELICLAKENDLSFITLEVRRSNEVARRLYENFDFDEVGVRPDFYVNPVEDAILMTRIF